MTTTSQTSSNEGAGGSGGMEELLPLVLQLTNPEQVSKMSAVSAETCSVTENYDYWCTLCLYCNHASASQTLLD